MACVGVAVSAIAVIIVSDILEPHRLPGDRLGWRRFHTPNLEGSMRLGERFKMNADGLTAIDIRPVATGTVHGRILLELQAFDGVKGAAIRSAVVDAAALVQNDSYRFEFAPVSGSAGRVYQLEMSSSGGSPSSGVALWATQGERFRGGALIANGAERWADLAFAVHATSAPPVPGWLKLGNHVVQLTFGALALCWTAVAYALRQLARYDETPENQHDDGLARHVQL